MSVCDRELDVVYNPDIDDSFAPKSIVLDL